MNAEPDGIAELAAQIKTPPIKLESFAFNISREELWQMDAERFPRKGHQITHPLTDADRADYAALKARWEAARAEWETVQVEAERRGWGTCDGGYDYEPAELHELKPRTEWVYDEPEFEWRVRVDANLAHHKATGEWLETPARTFHELITDELAKGLLR